MRISVIGCGYLGATHAACMAELGHDVVGIEADPAQRAALAAGVVPFYEPGLPELLDRHVASGRLRFVAADEAGYAAAADADLHFICVGTPQRTDGPGADTGQVESVVESLAPHLTRPTVVVGKSTVPVGTAARTADRLAELAPAGDVVELAWNPEFLREGHAVDDTLRPDRIVIGSRAEIAEKLVREFYAPLLDDGVPLVSTDLATAELVKVAANAFLATKISFVNAVGAVCEAAGGDVVDLAEALGHDARIGRRFLDAGLGFGGGCLPKDIRAFGARAEELGVWQATDLLRLVDDVNLEQRHHVVRLTGDLLGGVTGRRIAVWGAAFKPHSDDVRDSPALAVANALRIRGAHVVVHDPEATETARARHPELTYATCPVEAATGAEAVLHLTEWPAYRDVDPQALGEVVGRRVVVDARNRLDHDAWRSAGWHLRALGRAA